jgi:diguanylate cyclase (GGDEF)-like protein/PAS domain S-box-containing protein
VEERAVVELVRASMMPSALLVAAPDLFDRPPLAVNHAMAVLLGADEEELVRSPLAGVLVERPSEEEFAELADVVASDRQHLQIPQRLRRPDGREVPVELLVSRIDAEDEALLLVQCLDMTERDATALALADADERLRLTIEHAPIPLAVVSIDGVVQHANSALCRFLQRDRAQLVGASVADLTHDEDLGEDLALMEDLLAGRRSDYSIDKRYVLPDGSVVWGRLTVALAVSSDGRPLHFVSQLVDTTDERRRERELLARALRDPLTQVANRRALFEAWAHLGVDAGVDDRCGGGQDCVGVLFCDLDRFKEANDAGGHRVGDELLRLVAQRIGGTIRPGDLLARLGGDEFVVLCRVRGPEDALALARRVLHCFDEPFSAGDQRFRLSVSIGVSVGPAADDPDHRLAEADAAMYRAKRSGGHVALAER